MSSEEVKNSKSPLPAVDMSVGFGEILDGVVVFARNARGLIVVLEMVAGELERLRQVIEKKHGEAPNDDTAKDLEEVTAIIKGINEKKLPVALAGIVAASGFQNAAKAMSEMVTDPDDRDWRHKLVELLPKYAPAD